MAATGYLVRNFKLLSREKWLQDTVEHTFMAFQGVTLGCAKCHAITLEQKRLTVQSGKPGTAGRKRSRTLRTPEAAREEYRKLLGGDFPSAGATFLRSGSLFHVVSLTAKTAKIAIVGGSYADGAPAITLKMGTPLTLQNTADGTKYTLILEPPTTPLPGATGTVASAPTSTTSVLP